MDISPEILELIDEVRNDRTHGASELARQAASVMKSAAMRSRAKSARQFWQELQQVGQELMSARPAMAPLYNIVSRLLGAISGKVAETELGSIRRFVTGKADELIEGSLQAVSQVADHASRLIAEGDTVMTHSYSSTVVTALKKAAVEHSIRVIATRSGPGRTGEIVARQLSLDGVPVTFIDDTAVGLYVSTASKVMVGADRICADGTLVNGIGTYPLALAAERAGIPFYVLCETLKFDPRRKGEAVEPEEKEPAEVVERGRLPAGVSIKNPYFDITPPELVTGVVTENGLLTLEQVVNYMQSELNIIHHA